MWSYQQHEKLEKELSGTDDLPSCYTKPASVDAWRHRRMLETLLPLIRAFPDAKWLTVGDGKFGSDAYFLQTQGVAVVATSISSHTLEVAHSKGYIQNYAAENAEAFSLEDNSVDFVLCKESYHHFPRPPIGFYEMLRIAKKAVVLIEPIEGSARPMAVLKSFAKRMLRGDATEQFEVSGNFLYRLSIRETFKMLTGVGYGGLAWKGINDFYLPRFATVDAEGRSLGSVATRFGIGLQNLLSRTKMLNYGLASVICFKEQPSEELASSLRRGGFTVLERAANPYTKPAGG